LEQFTPAQWDKDEWHPLLGPWRFIQVLSLCIVFLTVELNTFFLKFCLWVPPRNPVIVYRLILWWLIAIPTTREYNSYLQDRYSLPLSPNVVFLVIWRVVNGWITCMLILIEIMSIYQKACEKGRRFLLAFPCYLHRGTSHLHQVWTWYALNLYLVILCFHLAKIFSFGEASKMTLISCRNDLLFWFLPGLYPKPMPAWLVIFWTSVGVSLVIFLIMWSWKSLGRKRRWIC
jgi:hypothetical protein